MSCGVSHRLSSDFELLWLWLWLWLALKKKKKKKKRKKEKKKRKKNQESLQAIETLVDTINRTLGEILESSYTEQEGWKIRLGTE